MRACHRLVAVVSLLCFAANVQSVSFAQGKDSKEQAKQIAQKFEQEKTLEAQEKKILAEQHFKVGDQYYRSSKYDEAKQEFLMAYELDSSFDKAMKYVSKCDKALAKARQDAITSEYRKGVDFYRDKNYIAARDAFNKVLVLDPGHSKAKKYKARSERAISTLDVGGKVASQIGAEQTEKADILYEEGVRLYNAGNYGAAKERLESAIAVNPVNIPARRYLEIINERKNEFVRRDEHLAIERAMYDVRKAWLMPKKSFSSGETKRKSYKKTDVKTEQQLIMEEKARQIVPEINFTDAHLRDVIKYLSKISGVNIILDEDLFRRSDVNVVGNIFVESSTQSKTGSATGISEDSIFDDEFAEDSAKADTAAPAAVAAPTAAAMDRSDKITISLTNIPLIEALKYILTTKGLKYRIDDYAILVSTPERLMDVEMETRFYHLSSGAGDFVDFETEAQGDVAKGLASGVLKPQTSMSMKDVLEQSGVPFPPGSKIFLDKKSGTLLVRNTPSNLTLIEDILRTLDVAPFQIAIQAKFIEIQQTDAKELGFDWSIGDWNVNNSKGDGTVQMNASDMSRGMRFFGDRDNNYTFNGDNAGGIQMNGVQDNVFRLVGTLTDPQFSVVLRAIDQSGNANQLSAPRVTTVNNQSAQIRVVREYIYPTEYESTPPTTNESGAVITPGIVTPKSFVTRNVGIILEVTPSAGSDRKTIHMTIVPEVSELVDWINYGVEYGNNSLPINQPLFSNRTLSTSVVVNDGDTVVLGGLMRDIVNTINDKVPLVGDLPLVGRLFRNEGEHRTKTNLLIFVTADLITPSGVEIRNTDFEYDVEK